MSTPSPAEYETRIRALEKLNATLAAEVDRMRPLVEAVLPWRYTLHLHRLDSIVKALDQYHANQAEHGQIRTATTEDTGERGEVNHGR